MSTTVVADLDLDDSPDTLAPSIVFTSFSLIGLYDVPGVLRVIDGATCAHQLTLPGDVRAPASPAVGDLDGDGRPEIVAAGHFGGVMAYRYDASVHTYVQWWTSAECVDGLRVPDRGGAPSVWAGPSIYDLNDDGAAEVVFGATA